MDGTTSALPAVWASALGAAGFVITVAGLVLREWRKIREANVAAAEARAKDADARESQARAEVRQVRDQMTVELGQVRDELRGVRSELDEERRIRAEQLDELDATWNRRIEAERKRSQQATWENTVLRNALNNRLGPNADDVLSEARAHYGDRDT